MRVRIASAGTGKTTSLVRRYVQLVAEGVPLRRVAGVTYTRSAAEELRERVAEGIHAMLRDGVYLDGLERLEPARRHRFETAVEELPSALITTVHGFLGEALRLAAPALGLDPDFAVLGEWQAEAVFEEETEGLLLLAANPEHDAHAAARRLGSRAGAHLRKLFQGRSLSADLRPADAHAADLTDLFEAAYARYRQRLGPASLAPAEVEREGLRLVASPSLGRRVVARYPLLLVDEYQDVNPLQGAVFERLEALGARLEVVGDPKQSIYGFRHADVEVFRRAARAAAEAGALEPPLVHTRRHARRVAGFLNHLTATLAAHGLGVAPDEAPPVAVAGAQAEREGSVECLWWRDEERSLPDLRRAEAEGLALRLRAWHARGVPYGSMALLARSRLALGRAGQALQRTGVPVVLRQGRGFFERPEVRDLYHAVRVGLGARGTSLLAWARGPFGVLPPTTLARLAEAADPEAALDALAPAAAVRLRATRALVGTAAPLEVLIALVRRPLGDLAALSSRLDLAARDNVDALLVTLATDPPGDPERLLDRLERLVRDSDAGDVPRSGSGVQLLTVHAAKGLEWPLVALFDVGGGTRPDLDEVLIEPGGGEVALRGGSRFAGLQAEARARRDAEAYRLLYVAASRARDVLVLSGSHGRAAPSPWLRACNLAAVGPRETPGGAPPFVRRDVWRGTASAPGSAASGVVSGLVSGAAPTSAAGVTAAAREAAAAPLVASSWTFQRRAPSAYPALLSPSWLLVEGAGAAPPGAAKPGRALVPGVTLGADTERLAASDPDLPAHVPGRGPALGTLVHDAIARGVRADDPRLSHDLAAQEVLWPFPVALQRRLVAEASTLLAGYEELLSDGLLVPLNQRLEDHAELPFAFAAGPHGTVWQGLIDRVYRTPEGWFLDDYKTDRRLDAERYDLALAAYVEAFALVRGVRPRARLVDLRQRRIVERPDARLRALWAALDQRSGEGATT